MSRPHNRKQQQKLQKAKSKREDARRKSSSRALQHTRTALLARALRAPFGPCWISAALEETPDAGSPALISVLVTRRVGGLLLPCLILVDRTCLGVKNAFTGPPQTELELERLRRDLSSSGDRLRETDLLTAQSVVHHAIDYANSLGFAPHRDFQPGLIGERPSALLDTPLARPDRPMYVSGPDDNVAMVLARLDASVGHDERRAGHRGDRHTIHRRALRGAAAESPGRAGGYRCGSGGGPYAGGWQVFGTDR